MPKYPHVSVRLQGEDGNAMVIIARVAKALRVSLNALPPMVGAEERVEKAPKVSPELLHAVGCVARLEAWQATAVEALRDIVAKCLSEQAATAEEIVASRVDLTKALGFVLELLTQVGEQAQAVLALLEPVGKEQG